MKNLKWVVLLVLPLLALGLANCGDDAAEIVIEALNLPQSLHADAGGMQWWYEQPDGFGPLSGVPYETAGCGNCHTTSSTCESCHSDTAGTGPVAQPDACMACHGRIGKENVLGLTDLHMTDGNMVCSDCHTSGDIHGDGNEYNSMLEPGAIDADCTNCHTSLSQIQAHQQHGADFNCEACHTESVITCYNCHFQTLLDSHEKKAAAAFKNFVILGNDAEGKIRTMTYQSVFYDGKGFAAFGPFHGHTTTAEGRDCNDCHGNPYVQEMNDTGNIQLTWWDDGESKVKHAEGVIPFAPDEFEFQFVDFNGTAWEPVTPGTIQYQYKFATPLTQDQLDALATPMGEQADNLPLSLHADAGGMEWWYNQPDGFGPLSGVSYETAGCGGCHTTSETCESCHEDTAGTGPVVEPDACLACHGRIGKENVLSLSDLHMTEGGMVCSDCHPSTDIHGDGNEYDSMLEPGAVTADCRTCHTSLPSNTEHSLHGDDFNCEVCHSESVITCYNCHFQTLLDSHEKKAAAAFKNFAILCNDAEGELRTMTYQSVYYDDKGFVAFGPFHGHTTIAEGRTCNDCHDNDRIDELNASGEIQMSWWDDGEGKIAHTTGIIPFVPDAMNFQFLDFDGTNWVTVDPGTVQYQWKWCTPLTEDQLDALGVD